MNKKTAMTFLIVFCLLSNLFVAAQNPKDARARLNEAKPTIDFARAEAFSDGEGVWLRWQTSVEAENLGFNVYRIAGDQVTKANPHLIGGAYFASGEQIAYGRDYSFFDTNGSPDAIYYIESVSVSGQKQAFNSFSVKAVKDLTAVAGASSEALRRAQETAQMSFKRENLILPKDLQEEVSRGGANALDYSTDTTATAQTGVKIGVRQDGFYRVTRAELEAAGFDVNAVNNLWQLYVEGVEQAITIAPNGEYIEFYGRAINRNESDTQIYFLVVGASDGKRIADTVRRPIAGNVADRNYNVSFFKKEYIHYTSSILNGDKENFFGSIANTTGATVNFNLSGIDFSAPNAKLEIVMQGLTQNAHQTRVVLNGTELGIIEGSGVNSSTKTFSIDASILREGTNALQLNALGGSGDISLFDTLSIDYTRKFVADANKLAFYTNNYKQTTLNGFTSPNVRVFDMTNPSAPRRIVNLPVVQNGSAFEVRIPANRGRVMYAVADDAILSAASVTRNYPSSLRATTNSADLIIVAHRNWMAQAEQWATFRRADNLTVQVVDIEDVFDEFGFGVSSADAVSDFLRYAYENWTTVPRYVLLMGDASFDPKNHLGFGAHNIIPTRILDTIYMETGSDEALADLNNDGLAEIAVGRIPIRSAVEVSLAFSKVNTFEQTLPQARARGALCASDFPNGYDFEGLCNRVLSELPATIPKTTVNRAAPDAQTLLLGKLNEGRYIANYSGHGSTGVWAAVNFFSNTNAGQLSNGSNLTLFTMLTCLNGYFINPQFDAIGETLLKNPNGGAVATWSSTGLTTPDIQEVMAKRFYNQLGNGSMTRIGDLIKDAKTTIGGGRDVRLSWALLGDPTLKVK